jgi:hypothetical protein
MVLIATLGAHPTDAVAVCSGSEMQINKPVTSMTIAIMDLLSPAFGKPTVGATTFSFK